MEKRRIFVLPGELAVSKQPANISTLLGSCISVCLYNKTLKLGGMNHYMLPEGTKQDMQGKYGDFAIKKLIGMMSRFDPNLDNLEAKVYGGGAVVGHLNSGKGIGEKNIAVAKLLLREAGIKITTMEVGGNHGRKIYFNTETGVVEERQIEKSEQTKELEKKKNAISGRRIRVLVVDDSAIIRKIICQALSTDEEIEIVGEAEDPYHAREQVLTLDPDVITLDIVMPKMDGVTFLKKLMLHMPKPVIIVSSIAQKGSKQRLRAQDIGAVDVVDKEDLNLYKGLEQTAKVLVPKVKHAALQVISKRSKEEIGHL